MSISINTFQMAAMLKAVAAYFLFSGAAGAVQDEMYSMASTGLVEQLRKKKIQMKVDLTSHEVVFIFKALKKYADSLQEEGSAEERSEAEDTGRHLCKVLNEGTGLMLFSKEAEEIEKAHESARASFCGLSDD